MGGDQARREGRGRSRCVGTFGAGRPAGGLPALTTAFPHLGKGRGGQVHWADIRGALAQLEEEIGKFVEKLDAEARPHALEKKISDILSSVVNVARYLRIDPERALRGTTAKLQRRFRYIEGRLHERGLSPERVSLDELSVLWNEAKAKGID